MKIEHYTRFDKRFFHPRKREESSDNYARLLRDRERELEQAIQTGMFEKRVVDALTELGFAEIKHPSHAELFCDISILEDRTALGEIPLTERDKIDFRHFRHLLRLMFPLDYSPHDSLRTGGERFEVKDISNGFCFEAGEEFIEFMKLGFDRMKKELFIPTYVTEESREHRAFWTLYPYLIGFTANNQKGKRTVEVLRKLNTRTADGLFCDVGFELKHVLGYDDRMPTHLIARMFASRIMHA